MTAYSFESNLVDVKAYNWHMSAKPDTTLGTSNDTSTTSQILVGSIVTFGADTGSVDNAQSGSVPLGVATETRNAADTRPLTYTWAGVVRVMTDGTCTTAGDKFKPANSARVTKDATPSVITFGRVLEADGAAAGTIVMAYVNCA